MHARSLRPLVKTRAFGMTHPREKFKLRHFFQFETEARSVQRPPAQLFGAALPANLARIHDS
jgi:hypothetical protein